MTRRGLISFVDVLFSCLAVIAFLVILLPHVNPIGKSEGGVKKPGNLSVMLTWAGDHCADVDLWVQAPGDIAVGYSNLNGIVFNLLRDDLGCVLKNEHMNYENAYSRGLPPGWYTVNVHLFRNDTKRYPVTVSVEGSVKNKDSFGSYSIFKYNVDLKFPGQEITVARFKIDDDGTIEYGSMNFEYTPLRALSPEDK